MKIRTWSVLKNQEKVIHHKVIRKHMSVVTIWFAHLDQGTTAQLFI